MDQVWSNVDLYHQILTYLTSYERSKRCVVCKVWCETLRSITKSQRYKEPWHIIEQADIHYYLITSCNLVDLCYAVKSGDLIMFKFISSKRQLLSSVSLPVKRLRCADGDAFELACRLGYSEIAEVFITDKYPVNIDRGLAIACQYGHIEVAHIMIKHGATNFEAGLELACFGGHLLVARLMIKHGARNLEESFVCTCDEEQGCGSRQDRLEIIKLLIESGARDWYVLISACNRINWPEALRIVMYLLKHINPDAHRYWTRY